MKKSFFIILISITSLSALFNPLRDRTREGNRAFTAGDISLASTKYQAALEEDPLNAEVLNNLGNSLYRQQRYAEAATNYEQALDSADKNSQAPIWYNLGNARFKQQDYQGAVDAFIRSLKADDKNPSAKRNLEMARRKLLEQSKQEKKYQGDGAEEKKQGEQKKNNQQKEKEKQQQQQKQQQVEQKQQNNSGQGKDKQQAQNARPLKISKEEAENILKALSDRQRMRTNEERARQRVIPGYKDDQDW